MNTYVLHILFVQYKGEQTFNAIEIADPVTMDINPEFIQDKLEKALKSNEFTAARVIPIAISYNDVDKILNHTPTIGGEVILST